MAMTFPGAKLLPGWHRTFLGMGQMLPGVANRPRFGCYSPARSRFSYTEVAEGSAGQAPAERGGIRKVAVGLNC
jgi:hypothetical protein